MGYARIQASAGAAKESSRHTQEAHAPTKQTISNPPYLSGQAGAQGRPGEGGAHCLSATQLLLLLQVERKALQQQLATGWAGAQKQRQQLMDSALQQCRLRPQRYMCQLAELQLQAVTGS